MTIQVIATMIVVLAAYHLGKLVFNMIKEVLSVPLKGASASVKGIKRFNLKVKQAKLNKLYAKEAMKQIKTHGIDQLKAEANGFIKTDKIKKLESKIK